MPRDIKILRFCVLGFQGFATYPNFKVLGFQGLATIKILRSWVFRVSLHIKILRFWVSKVLRHNTILRSWVSRVPRQKGRARSRIHQGPRPWTQRTQDLEPFWNLGTSLLQGSQSPTVPQDTQHFISTQQLFQNPHQAPDRTLSSLPGTPWHSSSRVTRAVPGLAAGLVPNQ